MYKKSLDYTENLHFSNSNGALRANLNTGLTTQTLIGLYGLSLTINHLINLCGASVYTFLITGTFVFINNDFPHVTNLLKNKKIKTTIAQPPVNPNRNIHIPPPGKCPLPKAKSFVKTKRAPPTVLKGH